MNHVGVVTSCDTFFFGDFPSSLANDATLTLLVRRPVTSSSGSYTHFANRMGTSYFATGHYLASEFPQPGTKFRCGILRGSGWAPPVARLDCPSLTRITTVSRCQKAGKFGPHRLEERWDLSFRALWWRVAWVSARVNTPVGWSVTQMPQHSFIEANSSDK